MSNTGTTTSGPSGGGTLTGMAAVEQVFHFLDGPADVLRCPLRHRVPPVARARVRRLGVAGQVPAREAAGQGAPVRGRAAAGAG